MMNTATKRWFVRVGWTFAFVLPIAAVVYLALMSRGNAQQPLKVFPAGCKAVRSDKLCELSEKRQLRIWVESQPEAKVFILRDEHLDTIRSVDDGRLFQLTVAPGASRIIVVEYLGGRVRWATVPLALWQEPEPEWLREATKLKDAARLDEAFALVMQHESETLSPRDHALATSLRAEIEKYRNHPNEAKALYRRAMREDREAGLLSQEVSDALALSSLLGQFEYRFDEAERVLDEKRALFAHVPEDYAWALLQRALFCQMRGDTDGAMERLSEGKRWAERFNNAVVLSELLKLEAEILQMHGRTREMLALLDTIRADSTGSPCRKVNLLMEKGKMRLLTLEEQGVAGAGLDLDPRPYLEEGSRLRDAQCNVELYRGSDLVTLAQAELLYGNIEKADKHFREVCKLPHPDAELKIDLKEIEGRILLARGNWAEAAKAFEELREMAISASENADFDKPWRAEVGLAQALEKQGQYPQALEAYGRAERRLEERTLALPLGTIRGGGGWQSERATSRWLALLLKEKRHSEAFSVMRRARLRSLFAFDHQKRVARWTDDQRRMWRARYDEKRRSLSQSVAQLTAAPESEKGKAIARIHDDHRAMLAEITKWVTNHRGDLIPSELPPTRRGEVSLVCHPVVESGWSCIVEEPDGKLRTFPLPSIDVVTVANRLIAPLAPMLRDAHHLRVLAFGALRKIDFEALQLDGRPLGDVVRVSYALDLARIEPPASGDQRSLSALAVVDATNDFVRQNLSLSWIESELAVFGRPEVLYSTQRRIGMFNGQHFGANPHVAKEERLRRSLSQASFFLYFGHSFSLIPGESTLWMGDGAAFLTSSDIFALERVPAAVALFGCRTGYDLEQDGGSEGLARAFIVNGSSSVLAARRIVSARAAALLAREILELSDDLRRDMGAAFQKARRSVREKLEKTNAVDSEELIRDINSFRLFER